MYTIFIGWDWRVYFARVRHDSIIDADNLVTSEVPHVNYPEKNPQSTGEITCENSVT